jgi:hypothetical protein
MAAAGVAPDPTPPPARAAMPEIKDAEVAGAVGLLSGTVVSQLQGTGVGGDGVPVLALHMARVDVTGLDNAVYFEIARGDSPDSPFRQGIMHVYKAGGGLRLRVMDFASAQQGNGVVGLWLAPEVFPPMDVSALVTNVELGLTKEGDVLSGRTGQRFPTTRHGAWEIESAVSFAKDKVVLDDRGFAADGRQVFGEGTPGSKRGAITLRPQPVTARVARMETGVVAIDLAPPKPGATVLQPGMTGFVHFSGWLLDGTLIGTSRQGEGKPQAFTLPGRMIAGWNQGMPGMTVGVKRRLYVPPGMGFGSSGSRDGRVPPDAWLTFEVECMFAEEAKAPIPGFTPPAPGAAPANPAAPAGGSGK